MTDQPPRDREHPDAPDDGLQGNNGFETDAEAGATPPHPSQAEGEAEEPEATERPPRPSQAEGDR